MSKFIRHQGHVPTVSLPVKMRPPNGPKFPKPRIRKAMGGMYWICEHGLIAGMGLTIEGAYITWGKNYYKSITKPTGFPNPEVEGHIQFEEHPPFI